MKCYNCGEELTEDTKFCSFCGAKVQGQTPPKKVNVEPEDIEDDVEEVEEYDDFAEDETKDSMTAVPPIFNPDFLKKKAESLTKKVESFSETFSEKAESFSRSFGVESKSSNTRRPAPSHTTRTAKKTNPKTGLFVAVGAVALVVIIVAALIIGGLSSNDDSGNRLIANQTFDAITPVVSGDAKLEIGREYAYMTDAWNVYIAKAVSADVLKIEHWDKTTQNDKTMEYSEDLGSFKISDEANGFSWVDDAHTAFTFIIQDKYNSEIKKPTAVVFTINISDSDKDKGTDYDEDIACYSYENDDWHIYRAVPLTDTLIKIECWYRTSSGFLSSHRFAWDVGVINTETTGTDFAWNDESRTAFTITMKDPANGSYWKEEKLTSFILENKGYEHFSVQSFLDLPLPDNNQEETTDNQQGTTYTPDYTDAESFEAALNNGAKVNGKIVQFVVVAYKPNSALGINCWAGEHLNFISENELNVTEGDVIIGYVSEEPSKTMGSWKIPYIVLAINEANTDATIPSKPEDTKPDDTKPEDTKPEDTKPEDTTPPANTAGAPDDWTNLLEKHYEEVKKKFEDAGFTNIVCVAHEIDYNENNTLEGSVVNIAIGENGENCTFSKGEQFAKDVKIRIDYRVKPAKPASEYEKAYIRDMSNYDLYYMFDTDTKTVVYFGTNDTYIEKGTYTGDFATGVTITWSHGEWTEKFTHKSGNTATLIDGNGWDWEYKVCDVEKAQKVLDSLK